ncbi:MAG: LCP family protein [Propionibacteriaceae bacterium]|nr:LCP family protein [Propionibacteriaceae bacterium]
MDDKDPFGTHDWSDDQVIDDPAENRLKPVARTKRPAIASIVIAAVLVLIGVAGVVVLAMTQYLPTGLFVLAVALDLIVVAGVAALLLVSTPRSHPVRFWVSVILAIVMAVGNLGVVKVGADFLSFTNKIQAPSADMVLYDVVVSTSGINDISQLAGTQMGQVAADPLSDPVQAKVLSLVNVSFEQADSWVDLTSAVAQGSLPSVVIQDGFMQVLSDADPATYASLTILTSFEIDSALASTAPPSTATPPAASDAFVIYVSGIDTYGNVSTRSRSDVNQLIVVNPTTGKILLVNTPRDFYVQLRDRPGLKDKLTHAGVYGIDVSMGTLEDLYDTTINYYLRINFSSLVTVVDALGGVDVDSAYAFSYGGYTFHQGMNHLTGAAALAFSRDRHDFATGDRIRGENQQRVITGIIHKLSDPSVLLGYSRILDAVQGSIQTSMPQDVIAAQVRQQVASGRTWTVDSMSVNGSDGSEYTFSYPGQRLYVMIPDQSTVDAAKAAIKAVLAGQ